MQALVYATFDMKAKLWNPPFVMTTEGEAVRAFSDAASKPGTVISRHPEDFALYQIGTFDNETGEIVPLSPMKSLGNAAQHVVVYGDDEKQEEMFNGES